MLIFIGLATLDALFIGIIKERISDIYETIENFKGIENLVQ